MNHVVADLQYTNVIFQILHTGRIKLMCVRYIKSVDASLHKAYCITICNKTVFH